MLEQYDRDFMTPKEVAHELGVREEDVRDMLRRGVMPGKKVGFRWFVSKEWLKEPSNQGNEYV